MPANLHGILDDEYRMAERIEVPEAFVATIPDGRVVGEHGAVVTPDGYLLQDVSWPVGSLRAFLLGDHGSIPGGDQFFIDARLPARKVGGTVAVLSAFVGRGYFHWLCDVLPRLGLLADAGIDLKKVDAFVVPGYFTGFQVETLTALGIGRDRIISSLNQRHIQAEELLIPSLPRRSGVVSSWSLEALRRLFPPSQPRDVSTVTRIYIVRKATDHGLLENEDQLTMRLRADGFEPLALENFNLSEKAWLLGQAEAVIGPSGAGLCNVVFCNPGTKVIELRVQPFPILDAWDISNRLGLEFFDVLPVGYGGGSREGVTSGAVRDEDVLATLELAGLA